MYLQSGICSEPTGGSLQHFPDRIGGGSKPPPQEPFSHSRPSPRISALWATGVPPKMGSVTIKIAAKGSTPLIRLKNTGVQSFMCFDNVLCDVYVKSTPKTKAMPLDHPSSVSHVTVVGFSSPAPVIARSSHSDRTAKATTNLHGVRFSSDAVENPPAVKLPQAGVSGQLSTGLSMELCGVSLSPNGQGGLADGSPDQEVRSAKHCLDFEDSDCDMRSPKIARLCAAVDAERSVCEQTAGNCVKNSTPLSTAVADCNNGRQHKNVVIHTSLPISVPESRRDPADVPTVTPVNQRSHKFLVCHHSVCLSVFLSVCNTVHFVSQGKCRWLKVVPSCSSQATSCSLLQTLLV